MQITLGWWLLYALFRGENNHRHEGEFSLWRILALILGFVGLMVVVHFSTL